MPSSSSKPSMIIPTSRKRMLASTTVKTEGEGEGEEEPVKKKRSSVVITKTKVTEDVKPPKPKKVTATNAIASGSGSGSGGSSSEGFKVGTPSGSTVGDVFSPGEGQLDYKITQPEPTRNATTGEFKFADTPGFTPNVSPEEILRLGGFGGTYWRVITTKKTGQVYRNDWGDLPKSWYAGLDKARLMTNMTYNAKVNRWGVKCGQTYDEWEDQGWFEVEHDSRGWYHWYCRFYVGRRCADDKRQISRWSKICSPASGRFRRTLLGKYMKGGLTTISPTSEVLSKGIRQTLFHWAYDPKTTDLAAFIKEKS